MIGALGPPPTRAERRRGSKRTRPRYSGPGREEEDPHPDSDSQPAEGDGGQGAPRVRRQRPRGPPEESPRGPEPHAPPAREESDAGSRHARPPRQDSPAPSETKGVPPWPAATMTELNAQDESRVADGTGRRGREREQLDVERRAPPAERDCTRHADGASGPADRTRKADADEPGPRRAGRRGRRAQRGARRRGPGAGVVPKHRAWLTGCLPGRAHYNVRQLSRSVSRQLSRHRTVYLRTQ